MGITFIQKYIWDLRFGCEKNSADNKLLKKPAICHLVRVPDPLADIHNYPAFLIIIIITTLTGCGRTPHISVMGREVRGLVARSSHTPVTRELQIFSIKNQEQFQFSIEEMERVLTVLLVLRLN